MEKGQETLAHNAFAPNDPTDPRSRLNSTQVKSAQTEYGMFKTRALNIVGRAFGVDDDHYQSLQRLSEDYGNYPACLGIVQAALYANEAGLLFDMKSLITSELLGDFIEQAETLLAAGYHVPAASLAGAVLEDTLRKL